MALEIQFDGASRGNPGPAAAGVVLRDPQGRKTILEAGYFLGKMTNNQAEYQGLLLALRAAEKWGNHDVVIRCDSELIVRQVLGEYRVKSPDLKPLYEEAMGILGRLPTWSIKHVRRHLNSQADGLANKALDARGDVIEIDLVTARRPQRAAAPAPAKRRTVEVRVVKSPQKGGCPAGCKAGDTFVFTERVPADLCVDGCAAAIEAVLKVRDGKAGSQVDTVTCKKRGCGGAFAIELLD